MTMVQQKEDIHPFPPPSPKAEASTALRDWSLELQLDVLFSSGRVPCAVRVLAVPVELCCVVWAGRRPASLSPNKHSRRSDRLGITASWHIRVRIEV
jgi:hypothetical protein